MILGLWFFQFVRWALGWLTEISVILATTIVFALAMYLLAGCGDDRPPTWGDAWSYWDAEWCSYARACSPGWFADHYASEGACFQDQRAGQCAYRDCASEYPAALRPELDACLSQLADYPCGEWLAPDACYTAYSPAAP